MLRKVNKNICHLWKQTLSKNDNHYWTFIVFTARSEIHVLRQQIICTILYLNLLLFSTNNKCPGKNMNVFYDNRSSVETINAQEK
jgi:hypothetical protein